MPGAPRRLRASLTWSRPDDGYGSRVQAGYFHARWTVHHGRLALAVQEHQWGGVGRELGLLVEVPLGTGHQRYDRLQFSIFYSCFYSEVKPDIVEIVTWNDYGESHCQSSLVSAPSPLILLRADIVNPNPVVNLGSDAPHYVDGTDHSAWQIPAKYYIQWFKSCGAASAAPSARRIRGLRNGKKRCGEKCDCSSTPGTSLPASTSTPSAPEPSTDPLPPATDVPVPTSAPVPAPTSAPEEPAPAPTAAPTPAPSDPTPAPAPAPGSCSPPAIEVRGTHRDERLRD